MIVYEATREIFINDVINNQIASRIEQLYRLRVLIQEKKKLGRIL